MAGSFSGRFVLFLGLGVLIAIAGHFSQSSILGHEKEYRREAAEAAGAEGGSPKNGKKVSLIRAVNPGGPGTLCQVDQKPCDGYTPEECQSVCEYHGLPKSECSGCLCLCNTE